MEQNNRLVLYLDGTGANFAETPAIPLRQTDLTISVWIKLVSPLAQDSVQPALHLHREERAKTEDARERCGPGDPVGSPGGRGGQAATDRRRVFASILRGERMSGAFGVTVEQTDVIRATRHLHH